MKPSTVGLKPSSTQRYVPPNRAGMDEPTAERGVAKLADEFGYGKWDRHFGHVRTQPEFNVQLGSSARLSSRVRRVCSWSYRMA